MFDFLFGKTEKLNLMKLYDEAIAFADELGLEPAAPRISMDKPLRFYIPNIKRSDDSDYFMSIYMHKILGEDVPFGISLPKNFTFYRNTGNLSIEHYDFGESKLPTDFACTRPAWEQAKKKMRNLHEIILQEYNEQLFALKQIQIFKSQMNFKV